MAAYTYKHPIAVVCKNGIAPVADLSDALLSEVERIVEDERFDLRLILTSIENPAHRLVLENSIEGRTELVKYLKDFCKESAGYFLGIMSGCNISMEILPNSMRLQYSSY